jgi:DNA-binding NarL/FixJ family response regulator
VIRVLIIEDERPAVAKLRAGLQASGEEVEVVGVCDSVRSGVQWLESQPHPDLILADIQLTDGTSFQIFEMASTTCSSPSARSTSPRRSASTRRYSPTSRESRPPPSPPALASAWSSAAGSTRCRSR